MSRCIAVPSNRRYMKFNTASLNEEPILGSFYISFAMNLRLQRARQEARNGFTRGRISLRNARPVSFIICEMPAFRLVHTAGRRTESQGRDPTRIFHHYEWFDRKISKVNRSQPIIPDIDARFDYHVVKRRVSHRYTMRQKFRPFLNSKFFFFHFIRSERRRDFIGRTRTNLRAANGVKHLDAMVDVMSPARELQNM